MKLILTAIAAIMIIAIILAAIKHRSRKTETADRQYNINLSMLLSDNETFRPENLIEAFKKRWGMSIVCAESMGLVPKNGHPKVT